MTYPFPPHPNPNMSEWYGGSYGQLAPAGNQWIQGENIQNQHDPFLTQATPPYPRPQPPPTPQLNPWVAQNYPVGVGDMYGQSVYGSSDMRMSAGYPQHMNEQMAYAITPTRDPYTTAPTPMRAPEASNGHYALQCKTHRNSRYRTHRH
ncbi:hypothetical protein FIBSPDRAFT_157218 [Athelia psychrophila]|uniref:Uncharacterized protein n=1 Tax=Athelia psychrophila TaxID=1759441 RepID=A0A166B9W6_9AGAM|nr:hypothetical protein FIBSPDRAFT_157218 [Fibularhizoctonia sp. CBS 109695]